MKALTGYSRNGFKYKIVKRKGKFALAIGASSKGGTTFEVIEVQHHNGLVIAGNAVPPSEFAPSNNQWGTKGWTFRNKQTAEQWLKTKASRLSL